jgi:hypothetical protein
MTDGQTIADIGHDLRARKVSEVAARYGAMTAANLVDDDHVVANFGDGYPMFPDVGIVDVSQNKVTLLGRGDVVGFERSTGIVVIVRGQTLEVRRYDRKKATFGDAVSTTIDNGASILMLDGKHGDVAVAISHEDELIVNVEVYRLREELEFVKTRTIRPPLEWWDSGGFVAFVPPSWLPSAARPSPDGAMVAEVRDGRIQLRDATGSERWLVPATGANDVVWTPAGELVAVGAGIARLDLTTGEFRERQCGWRFGLWSDEPLATNNPLLCEAP